MLPPICAETRRIARKAVMERVIAIARVTCYYVRIMLGKEFGEDSGKMRTEGKELTAGLNNPPDIRKNTHTLTMREKPKTRAM